MKNLRSRILPNFEETNEETNLVNVFLHSPLRNYDFLYRDVTNQGPLIIKLKTEGKTFYLNEKLNVVEAKPGTFFIPGNIPWTDISVVIKQPYLKKRDFSRIESIYSEYQNQMLLKELKITEDFYKNLPVGEGRFYFYNWSHMPEGLTGSKFTHTIAVIKAEKIRG